VLERDRCAGGPRRSSLPSAGSDLHRLHAGRGLRRANYINALGGVGADGVDDGIKLGQAAASDLIAYRTGDRNESITFTPGPLTPGGWTFAPPPSLQTAQTPWVATMKPFMLTSASQFRVEQPPSLSSRTWAREFNEVKAYGAVNSTVRSTAQTAVAQFWNANAVNQSNQAFQDIAITQRMDLAEAARLLAMGDLVDSDAGIACWDAKYHYLFWRPIMAIRNAQIDNNPATTPDANWTPLLTTPNHPEYPAAHTCLSGAEAEIYAAVLGTHHIDVTIHGSADGTPNNWAATHTFKTVKALQQEVVNARVWAGLHYSGSALEGLELARDVARWTLQRYFLPAS
jgi:vanadium-dependent haloperoxidase-like protein